MSLRPSYELHGLFRMSFGNHVGVDMGVGTVRLEGNRSHGGVSIVSNVLYHPARGPGWEIRPALDFIGNNVLRSLDVGLLTPSQYGSLVFGYKAFWGPGEWLHGPYAGISLRI